MNPDINFKERLNLDLLLSNLKKEDGRYANMSKALQAIYFVLAFMIIIMTLIDFLESKNTIELISGISFTLSLLIFALLFRGFHKDYKNVDYSLPTLTMLKKAAYRYKPFQLKTSWAFAAILLMDIGLSLKESFIESFITVQILFLGSVFLATVIGLIVWVYKYKPLRDSALSLIAEIERE